MDKSEVRKEAIKNWLKKKDNLFLAGILIFAFVIRWYYFILTKVQPLWWDEAAYGSLAKSWAYGLWSNADVIVGETLIRPPLFPMIWSVLVSLGVGEVGVRFLLEFVPSVFTIFAVYLIGKEMHSRNVGLISAFIFSVLWIHLFYTARLLTHVPALPLLFFGIYFFFKSMKEEFIAKYFIIGMLLVGFNTLMRYPEGLAFFAFFLFIILTGKLKLFKEKKFWLAGIIGMAPVILFFLYNFATKGNIFPALLGSEYMVQMKNPFAFSLLNYIPAYLTTLLFIPFLIGFAVALFQICIGYDFISKKKELKGNLLLILLLIVVFSYFIFQIRGAEDRWLFSVSISMVYFSALGMNFFYEQFPKYKKILAVILIGILAIGAYNQLNYADDLIKSKKDSFLQIRQGFEWLGENTPKDSKVMGAGIQVYSLYYAEKEYEVMPKNDTYLPHEFDTRYLVVHGFTEQPEYINDYLSNNQDKWRVVNVFFLDEAKTQPIFVVYERI